MTVSVKYTSTLETAETLTTNATHQAGTITANLNTALTNQGAGSTQPCTLRAGQDLAMSGGAATIDLTALVGTNGAAVDGSGLRVQFAKFKNPVTNANSITIAKGASNGYDGFGAAFSITLVPGAEVLIRAYDGGGNIAAGNKTLDISGTLTQALSYEMVLG